MKLEPLRASDIDEIVPIEQELFGAERWTAGMFRSELERGYYYLIARDEAGAAVGYAGLALAPPEEAWVNNLAVRRAAQRHGIGRALLAALLAEAARHRVQRVLLEVAVDNGPALKLYAQYGFETISVRRRYYQPSNTDALVMMREQ
jgi:[ribosomal protein S18]-alanine N-acetyltransferase